MSVVLVVTAIVAASIEHSSPHGALLILTLVALPPAVVVDVLVLRGPVRRPFRDPLTAPENVADRDGVDCTDTELNSDSK